MQAAPPQLGQVPQIRPRGDVTVSLAPQIGAKEKSARLARGARRLSAEMRCQGKRQNVPPPPPPTPPPPPPEKPPPKPLSELSELEANSATVA